jgi:hypothetical protein
LQTRPIVELPRFSAWLPNESRYLDATEVDARIRERVERTSGGIDGKIVRLVIDDVPRDLFRDLDHRRLREYRARALHFHLDTRRPIRRIASATGQVHTPRSLDEEVSIFLTEQWQPSSGDIDRARLASLAAQYLASAAADPDEPLIEPSEPGG